MSTAQFANPDTSSNTYRVCIYDQSGLLRELDLAPGGVTPTCAGAPCWKPSGTKGFKYKEKSGASDGIQGAKLRQGESGKSQVQIKARGSNLLPPDTATLSNVVVQLLIDDGAATECFKTPFPAANVRKQDAQSFKAKGP